MRAVGPADVFICGMLEILAMAFQDAEEVLTTTC